MTAGVPSLAPDELQVTDIGKRRILKLPDSSSGDHKNTLPRHRRCQAAQSVDKYRRTIEIGKEFVPLSETAGTAPRNKDEMKKLFHGSIGKILLDRPQPAFDERRKDKILKGIVFGEFKVAIGTLREGLQIHRLQFFTAPGTLDLIPH
jgi:hypothetical protein